MRRRQDELDAQLQDLMKHNLAKEKELIEREMEINDRFRERERAFRKREQDLHEREKVLRGLEFSLKQQGRNAEELVSQRGKLNDVGAWPNDQPLHDSQKDLPKKHAIVVEDGPNAFFPASAVSPTTPTLPKTPPVSIPPTSQPPPASPPPSSPPPTASIPSSGPTQSQCPQPEISTQDAANNLTYSCINCAKPDNQLMIACQNGKACLGRYWFQNRGGIHSGSDAWFHISHFGMEEAQLHELTKSQEDWYCPQCQKPTENTDSDEYTMHDDYRTPDADTPPDLYTMIKLHGRTKTHEPKKATTNKRRRQAATPDSKKSTNGEKSTKKSNRRKQAFWTNPLECAALIDSMRIVISSNDRTEQKFVTASSLMLERGFDRSRWQIKNKWNRELRKEGQRQGVPEDRRPKAGRKLVTGVQDPADRKRRREEARRALERSMFEKGNANMVEEMQDKDGEEDAEGEDCEEYQIEDDDDDEDHEEGEVKRKRQRFS